MENMIHLGILDYALLGGVLLMAAILQSIAGFGFNLFLLPVILSMDVMLAQAVAFGIVCSSFQRITSIRHLNHHIDWKTLRPMMIIGLFALFIGIAILHFLTSVKIEYIRPFIGILILLMLAAQLLRVKQRDQISWIWGQAAAFLSGLFNGIGNIGGPPIVLWILAHNWPAEKMRITTLAYTLIFVPVQLVLLIILFKTKALQACGIALVYCPLVVAGSWFGLHIGNKLNKKHIRIIMQILLLIIAVISIAKPLLS